MPRNCVNEIYSEDYLDYLVEYFQEEIEADSGDMYCYNIASQRFAVLYEQGTEYTIGRLSGIKVIPHCYGLLSSQQVLESAGIARIQRQPDLNLYGQGVLVGFVDTGIDYSHPAFINSAGQTRIISIWDQTVQTPREGESAPEGLGYGVEYTEEMINRALESQSPLDIVPSRDTNGHGTFIAGVACGNEMAEQSFSGVAPLASICMVKCKEAKQNLRNYYFINTDNPCYAESDIMLAVRYLRKKAFEYRMPLIICLGIGTNQGGHNRGGVLGEFLEDLGNYRGIYVVTAGGNEGNASHHYKNVEFGIQDYVDVEIRVGEGETGFTTELWTNITNLYSVALVSPDGEYSGKIQARLGEKREIRFLFGNTVVYIEYILFSFEDGDECIRLRFRNPVDGIWKIRVYEENGISGRFDMWLPIRDFISESTYFLRPNPDTTLCDPANNFGLITCTYYNSLNRSAAIESSRGFTREGRIKPDFAAPGIDVYGLLPFQGKYPENSEERNERARYGYRSGSSMAAAVTAGATALLTEWALLYENDYSMDTVKAKKYLIRGADRNGLTVPSEIWGNGTLDLYGVFDSLRPTIT